MIPSTKQPQRTLILHGWGGSDAPHWQAELASSLARGYGTVSFPLLDNCHFPSKNRWVKQLQSILQSFRPTHVVCHSLANTLWFWGCEEGIIEPVEKLYLVAPPSRHCKVETLKSFFPAPLPSQLYAKEVVLVVSDNDPYMGVDEAKELGCHYEIEPIILHDGGHINTAGGYGRWEWIEDELGRNHDFKH